MEKIRLLIADYDEEFTNSMKNFLQNVSEIELIGVEHDGEIAFQRIRTLHPDVVVYDLTLPSLDGIALLQKVNELNNPPAMICCTNFYSNVAVEATRILGSAYLMYKPVKLPVLKSIIISCTQLHKKIRRMHRSMDESDDKDPLGSNRIRNFIVSMGISSRLIGCAYLTEAVRIAKNDLSLLQNLSKGLYLEVSRNMGTSAARVDRCIRNAIYTAYQNGAFEGKMDSCPSNKTFINYLMRTIDQ